MTSEHNEIVENLISRNACHAYKSLCNTDLQQVTRIIKCGLDVYTLRLSVERRKPEGDQDGK